MYVLNIIIKTGGHMQIEFDFDRLKNIYLSTLESYDKATAFDIQIGNGRFLFMMYLSDEDKDAKDTLFIFMRNTNVMQKLKMYGNHKKGTFKVYMTDKIQKEMIKELDLKKNGKPFDFEHFLAELNSNIPLKIDKETKIKNLRDNKKIIASLGVVDEVEKTVLIGDKYLSVGKPQDKTLRKLYLYTDANPHDIDELIILLKKFNRTVAWTTEDKNKKSADIRKLISSIK